MTVPVHLVTGHLGAGKTSVLRHLLARRPASERVGLVVNDFGEARVDDALLSALAGERREIRGACVCCTAPAGFAAAVAELLPRVDRLFVEPTGLARPADLVDALRRAPFAADLALAPVIGVVDPAVAADPQAAPEVRDGLSVAEVVVINRADLAPDGATAALEAWLAASWPGPRRVVKTTFGVVPDDVLAPGDDLPRSPAGRLRLAAPAHGAVARSLQVGPEVVFRREAVEALLADPLWLRAKGLVRTDEGWLEVQRAAGRVTSAPTGWRRDTRVDLLAAAGDAGRADALLATRDGWLAPPHAADGVVIAWPGGARTLSWAALRALPGEPDVGARFPKRAGAGADLAAVLAAAGAPETGEIVVTALDGFTSAPAAREALAGGVLVHSLGAGPLPPDQGGPFRLLVPGPVGCANVKGVARIAVRPPG